MTSKKLRQGIHQWLYEKGFLLKTTEWEELKQRFEEVTSIKNKELIKEITHLNAIITTRNIKIKHLKEKLRNNESLPALPPKTTPKPPEKEVSTSSFTIPKNVAELYK